MIAIFIFLNWVSEVVNLRPTMCFEYHVVFSVMNIMLYSITHETSNYDLELVKSCLLYSQIKWSVALFSHTLVYNSFFFFPQKKKIGPLKRKKFQCFGFTFKVQKLCLSFIYRLSFLSYLLSSHLGKSQPSFSDFVFDILRHRAPCCAIQT